MLTYSHKDYFVLEKYFETVDICNFVINEFNPTFEVQNMGNEAFQNALF